MVDPESLVLAIAGLGCTSIVALIIAVFAKAKVDAAVDLSRSTSRRSQQLMEIMTDHLKEHDRA